MDELYLFTYKETFLVNFILNIFYMLNWIEHRDFNSRKSHA